MERECKICGEKRTECFYIKNKGMCKKCCIEKQKRNYRENKERYKEGYKKFVETNILQVRFLAAKHRAIRKKIPFEITLEDLENLLISQNGVCYYTGLPFINDYSKGRSISIDRIDSSKGYTKDNIRLICSLVNTMKSDRTEESFLDCIKCVYEYMKL